MSKLFVVALFMVCVGAAGIGLIIADIVDAVKARKAEKEGLLVYRYPF